MDPLTPERDPNESAAAPALLDVRRGPDFLARHVPGAAGIPLEELGQRSHELPPSYAAIDVTDADPQRAAQAAEWLRKRGHPTRQIPWRPAAATTAGPSPVRLWRPSPFLAKALARIASEPFIRSAVSRRARRALDIAAGSGRDAVHLALTGYDVLAIDLLPDALARAQDLAARAGVRIKTAVIDLEGDSALPVGGFDLVTVFRYLHRPLFPAIAQAVAPGGYLVYETFHERNRSTGKPPQNPAHLLKGGELAAAFAEFDLLIQEDEVERDGRFFSSLLGRRRAT